MHLIVRDIPPTVISVRTGWAEIRSSHKQNQAIEQQLQPKSVTSPPLVPGPRASQGPMGKQRQVLGELSELWTVSCYLRQTHNFLQSIPREINAIF